MKRLILIAVLGLALIAPVTAQAATESEPNDGINQFDGPMAGGTPYEGVLDNQDDDDWYSFYTSGSGKLEAEVTNANDPEASGLYFALADANGEWLNEKWVEEATGETIEYTAPGAGQYYLVVYSSSGTSNTYTAEVDGPIGTGAADGTPQPTPNNNPDALSAFGPLAGDTLFGGRLDTSDEEDWFHFYTAAPGEFDVALINGPDEDAGGLYFGLYDGEGEYLNEEWVDENMIGHLSYDGPAAAKYLVGVYGSSAGNSYELKITPGLRITTTPPPASSSKACEKATKKAKRKAQKSKKATAKVKKTKGKVKKSRGNKKRKAKKRLAKAKSKAKKAKGKAKSARAQKKDACG